MRVLFPGALAALLLTGQVAQAASCARPIEASAFSVEELKSQLMVTALACKSQDRYNAFMGRFQGDVASNEKSLNGFFARTYGKQAQKQHDDYITQLANAQSQQGIAPGSNLCGERMAMFDEVMALQTAQDLPDYARGKNLASPTSVAGCVGEPEVRQASTRKGPARKASRHKS